MNAHTYTPTGSPKAEAVFKYADVSPEARRLLAAIIADMARLRSLERNPTAATVAWAITALPGLRDMTARLEAELLGDVEDLIAARRLAEQP